MAGHVRVVWSGWPTTPGIYHERSVSGYPPERYFTECLTFLSRVRYACSAWRFPWRWWRLSFIGVSLPYFRRLRKRRNPKENLWKETPRSKNMTRVICHILHHRQTETTGSQCICPCSLFAFRYSINSSLCRHTHTRVWMNGFSINHCTSALCKIAQQFTTNKCNILGIANR